MINVGKPVPPKWKKGRKSSKEKEFELPRENSSELRKIDGQQPFEKLRFDAIDNLLDVDSLNNATKCKMKACTRKIPVFIKMAIKICV